MDGVESEPAAFNALTDEHALYIIMGHVSRVAHMESRRKEGRNLRVWYSNHILIGASFGCSLLIVIFGNEWDRIMGLLVVLLSTINACILSRSINESQQWRIRALKRILQRVRKSTWDDGSDRTELVGDEMLFQTVVRDGRHKQIPRLLLVEGDVVLLRAGQPAPVDLLLPDGQLLPAGAKRQNAVHVDPITHAAVPASPIMARAMSTPLAHHLDMFVNREERRSSSEESLLRVTDWMTRRVLPLLSLWLLIFLFLRWSSSLPVSISLSVLPLALPALPLLHIVIRFSNNYKIAKSITLPNVDVNHCIKDCLEIPKDLVFHLGDITGICMIDKKGILSPHRLFMERLFFFSSRPDGELSPETLHITYAKHAGGYEMVVEDADWVKFYSNLCPLAFNGQLNSCALDGVYSAFFDHVSAFSAFVPRTLAVSTRHCLCELSRLLGIVTNTTEKAKALGIYRRTWAEPDEPGVTRHKIPLEAAFCTVYQDAHALYSHMHCQGSASLLIECCSHVWDGNAVRPLNDTLKRTIIDFYHRHSMTGYCVGLTYRAVSGHLSPELSGKYFEVPLNRPRLQASSVISSSTYDITSLHSEINSAEQLFNSYFTDHVFCGLVALQYQVLPEVVQMAEILENSCTRFIYFSRENELRSRLFAEKLGLEAGWNCHISLSRTIPPTPHSRQFAVPAPTRNNSCPTLSETTSANKAPMAPPNKAQLPCGIEQVRPHLKEMDNVPLLVSLFTDTTPETTAEMVTILQENNERELVIGSSLNWQNTEALLAGALSGCLHPLPLITCHSDTANTGKAECAQLLMQLVTDFTLEHNGLGALPALLSACRARTDQCESAIRSFINLSVLIGLTQLLCVHCRLPPPLSSPQVLLLLYLVLPLLSLSIVFGAAPTQRLASSRSFSWVTYVLPVLYQVVPSSLVLGMIWYSVVETKRMCDDWGVCWDKASGSQVFTLCVLLCVCVCSSCSVFPLHSAWRRPSFLNPFWSFTVILILLSHSVYSLYTLGRFLLIPVPFAVLIGIWLFVMFLVCELFKMRHIKQFEREQRRRKFGFDTKLGMNSPY